MMRTLLFFVWRYLKGSDDSRPLSTLITISFSAIALGTFCLTLAAAIMHGFKQATYVTLQSIHADLIMESSHHDELQMTSIARVFAQEFPMIEAYSPRASNYVIVEKQIDDYREQCIVTFQAMDPQTEARTTHIEQAIKIPEKSTLATLLAGTTIIIGSKLAQDLQIKVGDAITIYYARDQETSSSIQFTSYPVTVAGIFSTGIVDYDAGIIWGSFELFSHIFHNGITSLGIRLSRESNKEDVAHRLQKRFGVRVQPWYALYPALFQALKLEEYALYLILFFIIILASLTMVSTLMLHIEHKKIESALLRAMGMNASMIRALFIMMGICIAGTATCCGMMSAWITSMLLTAYNIIALPDSYYISYIPAYLPPHYFGVLFLISCSISCIAIWYGTRHSTTVSISSILRSNT